VLEDGVASLSDLERLSQPQPPATNNHVGLGSDSPSSLQLISQSTDVSFGGIKSPPLFAPALMELDFGAFSSPGPASGMADFRLSPAGMSSDGLFGCPAFHYLFSSQYFPNQSPFSELQAALLRKVRPSIHYNNQVVKYHGVSTGLNSAMTRKPPSSRVLVSSLLQETTQMIDISVGGKTGPPPSREVVLDSLLSLLSETQSPDDPTTDLVTEDSAFDTLFYRALIFSMANGFAGLKDIPPAAVLKVLRKEPELTSQIFEYFRSSTPVYAKSLADNLFRAAVEACDEEAVKLILQATQGSANAIDPNEIVCKLGGGHRLYTPIEVAAKFRHLGIVKVLLAAGADINKTHFRERSHRLQQDEHRGLELAIRKTGEFEVIDMDLVKTLLDGKAEVRVDLIRATARRGQANLFRELFSRFPPAKHRKFFKSEAALNEIVQYLDNSLATRIIKQILRYCIQQDCRSCIEKCQKVMEKTLCNAARKGNVELVKFLLPHATSKDAALSAAVVNGSRELINVLLQNGAGVGGEPSDRTEYEPFPRTSPFYNYNSTMPLRFRPSRIRFYTTPLAEALRSRNSSLIHEFESLGALVHITQDKHFQAAILAAAEVGDCEYIRKLLQRALNKSGELLTVALSIAIHVEETEAALMLLDNGAEVNLDFDGIFSPMREAVKKQNRVVVAKLLEADVPIGVNDVEYVILWGDRSLIEDILFMRAGELFDNFSGTLGAAVRSRQTDLVNYFLKLGATPSYGDLVDAVRNDDNDMIQLLMLNGADPANESAILLALDNNQGIFEMLLRAFMAQYPQGKRLFGGGLLIAATKRDNLALFDVLLAAKMDVNQFSASHPFSATGNIEFTPLGFTIQDKQRAKYGTQMVRKLIAAGAVVNGIARKPSRNYSFPLETAIIVAIKTQSDEMVKLLIKNGADVDKPARLSIKRTPLQQACEIGSFKMVKLLLDNGATVDEPPAERGGGTALQLTASSGSIKIAELLLQLGADVHGAPSKVNGRTALEAAAENGRVEMIRVLWDAVKGVGFTADEIEKAKYLARSKGHRGYTEYIESLWAASNLSLLQTVSSAELDGGFWHQVV